MLRISRQNFVRITVLIESISLVAPSQGASQSPEAGRIFGGLGRGPLEQGK